VITSVGSGVAWVLNVRRVDLRVFRTLILPLIALCGACQPSVGGEGQSCRYVGNATTAFTCNAGLVCVKYGALCVRSHSEPVGGPCNETSDSCVLGLVCAYQDYDWHCVEPLGAGEACSDLNSCADGLSCSLECDGSSVCMVPLASSKNPCGDPQDAGDAMARDGMGPVDAGSLDSSERADAEGGADF
jgi:hypothetical protein